MLTPVANDPSLTMLRAAANGNYVVPAPTVGLVTEHFLLLLPKPGTVYLQTSSLLPVQQTRRLNTWRFKRDYD